MTFGERLALLRNKQGLSQTELAKRLNVSKSALAMYETNNREPNFEITNKFADYFGVSIDYLLCRTDDPNGTVSQTKINKHDETYDSLAQITKLAKKYGLEQLGFFDIEEWKNLGPEEIQLLDAQFKAIADMAKKRNEKK